jgi:hypothetical protein
MSDYVVTHNVFAEALTTWKRKSEWSDQRIADATGLHRDTVQEIRLGRNTPQWRTKVTLFENLPGFRAFCKIHAPAALERYVEK